MDKTLEAILIQLGLINTNLTKLAERVEKYAIDLSEFSDRFDEVVTQLEDERRLDLIQDYN
jgi:uncharacterized tellurite resistance protein B-like protein